MLGRVRFLAVRGSTEREVVLDPSSGEVLRDYSRASGGGERSQAPGGGTEGSDGHSGGGDDGDDGHDGGHDGGDGETPQQRDGRTTREMPK